MDMIIYGSQIFGRLVRELLTATGHRFIGFVDDVHDGDDVIGDWEEVLRRFAPGDCGLAIAIGHRSLTARRQICEKVRNAGFDLPALIHPSCEIAPTARIGLGCII